MEILKFIKWWWKNRDTNERVLIGALAIVFTLPLGIWFFGVAALLAVLLLVLVLLLGFIAYTIYNGIRNQWRLFNEAKEAEAQEIIDRLAGKTNKHFSFVKTRR